MSSDDHALSGAYAVDAVDDVERARFERHLADCAECQAEVDSLREAGSMLAETTAQAPRPELRAQVLGAIAQTRPLPPVLAHMDERRRGARRLPARVAAAVALVAVGAVGATVWNDQQAPRDGSSITASPADRVLQAADAQTVEHQLPDGGSVTVVRSPSLDRAVLVTHDMPAPPTGHSYEIWFQQGDEMVAAGAVTGGTSTKVLEGAASTASAVGITVEVAGEEPTEPSGNVLGVIPLEA